jgi:hypothetical protein
MALYPMAIGYAITAGTGDVYDPIIYTSIHMGTALVENNTPGQSSSGSRSPTSGA